MQKKDKVIGNALVSKLSDYHLILHVGLSTPSEPLLWDLGIDSLVSSAMVQTVLARVHKDHGLHFRFKVMHSVCAMERASIDHGWNKHWRLISFRRIKAWLTPYHVEKLAPPPLEWGFTSSVSIRNMLERRSCQTQAPCILRWSCFLDHQQNVRTAVAFLSRWFLVLMDDANMWRGTRYIWWSWWLLW
jgi:hypothetical protein